MVGLGLLGWGCWVEDWGGWESWVGVVGWGLLIGWSSWYLGLLGWGSWVGVVGGLGLMAFGVVGLGLVVAGAVGDLGGCECWEGVVEWGSVVG